MRFTAVFLGWMCVACSVSAAPAAPQPRSATSRPSSESRAARAQGGDGVVTFEARMQRGVLHVDARSELWIEHAGSRVTLDHDVIAEVAIAPDERSVIYPRRTALGTELVQRSLDDQHTRVLTSELVVADRPAIAPDGALLAFWGSSGQDPIVGLYTLDLRTDAPARRSNNRGIAIGAPGFIEPPSERSFAFTAPREVSWRAIDGEHRAEVSP